MVANGSVPSCVHRRRRRRRTGSRSLVRRRPCLVFSTAFRSSQPARVWPPAQLLWPWSRGQQLSARDVPLPRHRQRPSHRLALLTVACLPPQLLVSPFSFSLLEVSGHAHGLILMFIVPFFFSVGPVPPISTIDQPGTPPAMSPPPAHNLSSRFNSYSTCLLGSCSVEKVSVSE
jgi:hypothetical protein